MDGNNGSTGSGLLPILVLIAVLALIIAGVFLSREESEDAPPPRQSPAAKVVETPTEAPRQAPAPPAPPVPVTPEPPKDPREEARRWLSSRPVPMPALAYLFDDYNESLEPLGGTLLAETGKAAELKLEASGPVYLSKSGAVFLDGSRLLSTSAGQEISSLMRSKKVLSVEAITMPADTQRGGPARVVSISYDGGIRNFTLGQENDDWVVRLRTTKTDGNGTNPQLNYDKMLQTRRTHILFTYDGERESIYVDGKKVQTDSRISGDLSNWDTRFPLTLGNEAYDVRNWAGLIRFVAFYDRAVSAADADKMAGSLPPGDPPLGWSPAPPPPKPPLEKEEPKPPVEVEDVF